MNYHDSSSVRAAMIPLRTKEANEKWNEISPKLRGARSRLYRRRFHQVNTRWKALAEIYKTHSFAAFFKIKISAKIANIFSRLNIEFLIFFHFFEFFRQIVHFCCECWWNFVRISWQFPEKSDVCRFFNQICENKLENCRKFWNLWKLFIIIH